VPTREPADPAAIDASLTEVRRRGQRRLRRRRTLTGMAVAAVAAVIVPITLLNTDSGNVQVQVGTTGPTKRTTASGIIAGTLEAVGGAGPGKPRPLSGYITVRSGRQAVKTVSVGSDGTFSVPVVAGTYAITGRSPLYQDGQGDCGPAGPVAVTSGATRHVVVACEEK
jgi:hypothetical protein